MRAPATELLAPVRALFSDFDGTMTTDGLLEAGTCALLEKLCESGIPVLVVTGRPAGWAQAIATMFPVRGAVAENGGVTFVKRDGLLRKSYGLPVADLPGWRRRMQAAADQVVAQVPGARISADSSYREVDLAIDWNEEAALPVQTADSIAAQLRGQGFAATRSSVHINFGPPVFDKLSACKSIVQELFGETTDLSPYVFVGDSLNDASMFRGFERSVGVQNVMEVWGELESRPAFVTAAAQGAGWRELARHILLF